MGTYPIEDPAKRFWRKVNIPTDRSKCWLWVAGTRGHGYGCFTIRYKTIATHHFSYELCHGAIPPGLLILHTCHTPLCVNPEHLYAGTVQDNSDDMTRASRQAKGEVVGTSKLTEKEVLEIRSKHDPHKYTTTQLAREYNVCRSLVWQIIRRKRWYHI